MKALPKILVIFGLAGVIIGALGFFLPYNRVLQASFFNGLLLGLIGWSFSSNDDRDNIKFFLTTHRFGKFFGYILLVIVFIIAVIAIVSSDKYPSW